MDIAYQDFSLWIEPRPPGPGYRVTARSPAGEAWEDVQLPCGEAGPAAAAQPTGPGPATPAEAMPREAGCRLVAGGQRSSAEEVLRLGDELFRALLSGQIRHLFAACTGSVPDPSRGLRIRLHFDPRSPAAPALGSLPWELMYNQETRDLLGINPLTPVVRYLEVPRAEAAPPFVPPLRILLVASRPAAASPLALERESELIHQAWERDPEVAVKLVSSCGRERLLEELEDQSFDVLHFMGHAGFDETIGAGTLIFEGAEGSADPVPGEVFAGLLKGRLPRLVVLNACSSARSESGLGRDFFSGLAAALVLAGTPAVVAMRVPISDLSAISFSRALYRQLARGRAIDVAVTEGRRALYSRAPASREWATPVLFMRVPDGKLFASPEAPPPPRPQAGDLAADRLSIHAQSFDVSDSLIGSHIGPDMAGAARPASLEISVSGDFRGQGLQIFNRKTSN